jgi:hypothetical protein
MNLTDQERLNLRQLINETECENNTESIRKLKHSTHIRDCIRTLDRLKNSQAILKKENPDKFRELCQIEAKFLYDNYTDIFNKVLRDELDFRIMSKLLIVLKLIEDEKVDQHEGSVMIGKILKELYIDSAIKQSANRDAEEEANRVPDIPPKNVSWKQYKLSGFVEK